MVAHLLGAAAQQSTEYGVVSRPFGVIGPQIESALSAADTPPRGDYAF